MNRLLKTPDTYKKKLKGNPKGEYDKKLKSFVKKGEETSILTKKEAKFKPQKQQKPQSFIMCQKCIRTN